MPDSKNINKVFKSALNVNEGIEQPNTLNNDSIQKFKSVRKPELGADEYINGIVRSDITILSKAITIVESNKIEHFDIARSIVEECLPYSGNSIRIAITGIPGAGKSTFIETLGEEFLNKGDRIAVLAIDPSSEKSQGSILGDKTRMERLSQNKNVFIRPSPSSGTLGGVARKTRETIILCEAAGFNKILIETVGVGQSETVVRSMVDFFILLMISGAGDELQGVKRGIMEMADLIVINKADGDNIEKAKITKTEFENAIHYFPVNESMCLPKVLTASSLKRIGIKRIIEEINNYIKITDVNSFFKKNRKSQNIFWLHESIKESILKKFYDNEDFNNEIICFENLVLESKISSYSAAKKLINKYFK